MRWIAKPCGHATLVLISELTLGKLRRLRRVGISSSAPSMLPTRFRLYLPALAPLSLGTLWSPTTGSFRAQPLRKVSALGLDRLSCLPLVEVWIVLDLWTRKKIAPDPCQAVPLIVRLVNGSRGRTALLPAEAERSLVSAPSWSSRKTQGWYVLLLQRTDRVLTTRLALPSATTQRLFPVTAVCRVESQEMGQ